MKQRLYLILLLAAVTLSGMAQTIGEAFYIYRNDGQFNAFFRDEILSIEYSYEDAEGNTYDEIVTQIVNTADSVYKIPLAAIDSVGFVTPETKVNSDVFPLTAEHSPYITDADTDQFSMAVNTPEALLPKVGHIVVATADCNAFPDGIIAKVEERKNMGTYYRYSCSLASIDEVFDQLLIHSNQVEATNQQNESRGFNLRRATLDYELWNRSWTKTISGGGTTTTFNVGDRANVTVTARKTLTTPFYFQCQLQNVLTSSIEFNAKSSVGYWEEKQIGNTLSVGKIAVPYTMGILWFAPKLSLYCYFEEEGKVELNYSGHLNRTDKVVFTYTKGDWSFAHAPLTDVGTDIASLSMEGHAEIGLRPQIDFSLNGRKAGFGMSAKVGLREYINFTFDLTKIADGSLYDAMRDSYCRTTIPWSLTAHASADVFKKYDSDFTDVGAATVSYTYEPPTAPQWGPDRYIFPLFSNVTAQRKNSTTAHASATISRAPLFPVQVGFSLLDKDNKIITTQYDSRTYQASNLFTDYSQDLAGMGAEGKYKVRPSVKLFGQDVLASPSADVENDIEVQTLSATEVKTSSAVLWGQVTGYDSETDNGPVGFYYSTQGNPQTYGGTSLSAGQLSSFSDGRFSAKVSGLEEKKTYYYIAAYQDTDGNMHYGEVQSFTTKEKEETTCPDSNHPHWIDLGLPSGTQWRCCNEGASSPEAYGGYYTFGQVASAPTKEQIKELDSNCSYVWTTQNGVKGGKFTGPNGGTIFLPAAGSRWNGRLYDVGSDGTYWSSTPLDDYGAYVLYFRSYYASWNYFSRLYYEQSVRPVR